MIVWDFNVIVALAVSLTLALVLSVWVVYTFRRDSRPALSSREFFRQCGFCAYLYFDYFRQVHGTCPRCGSYQA